MDSSVAMISKAGTIAAPTLNIVNEYHKKATSMYSGFFYVQWPYQNYLRFEPSFLQISQTIKAYNLLKNNQYLKWGRINQLLNLIKAC